jgi:cell division septation protein DedD
MQVQSEIPVEQLPAPAVSTASTGEAVPSQARAVAGPQSQSRKYIVQVGSFVDRDKAEEIQKSLTTKGYSAFVKQVKDRGLGKVFVIQLKPVNSISTATTLSAQLGGELEGKPVIIEVPAN